MARSSICGACIFRLVQRAVPDRVIAPGAISRTTAGPRPFLRTYAIVLAAPVAQEADASRGALQEKKSHDDYHFQRDRKNLQRTLKLKTKKITKSLTVDPWKLAQHVEQTLAKNCSDEALLLTQQASKNQQVVVAWNHLIGSALDQQRLEGAVKLFNDMKRRGQLPNMHTYTVMFRGFAKSQHPRLAVASTVKFYFVLMQDKRIQPNSIHLNAALNVCAKAGDLDSMFAIAETANETTRAPTAYTYTTILNALRHDVLKNIKELSQEERVANLQKTLDRCKSLWKEAMEKWKQGRLAIDEELVCAMGRVLLLTPQRGEKRQVLDLLHQTMNIPKPGKDLDAGPKPEGETDPFKDPDMRNIAVTRAAKADISSSRAFYAVPGRNTLALLLTTLASSKLTSVGIRYWNLMVRHYGVVPDNDGWLRLMGMLKVARASSHAVSTLAIFPDKFVDAKPYQIAMETCVRDNMSDCAVVNATAVLDSMMARLPIPDLYTLRLYLRVALVSHFQLRSRARKGDGLAAKRDYGVQITAALARTWDPYKKIHYHYFKATPDSTDARQQGVLYNNRREVIALARLMYSCFNKVINEDMLPEKDLRDLRPIGAKINREIKDFYSHREQMEPRLRRSLDLDDPDPYPDPDSEPDRGLSLDARPNRTPGEDSRRHPPDFVWDSTSLPRLSKRPKESDS